MIVWQIHLGSERILSFFKAKVFSEYAKLSHSYALLKKTPMLLFNTSFCFILSLSFTYIFEISHNLVAIHSLVFTVEK